MNTQSVFDSYFDPNAVHSFKQSAPESYRRLNFASFVRVGLKLPAGFASQVRLINSWGNMKRGSHMNRYAGSLGSVTVQTSLSYQLPSKP